MYINCNGNGVMQTLKTLFVKTWILLSDAIFYSAVTAIETVTGFCIIWCGAERSRYRVLFLILQLTLDRSEQSAWRSVSFSKVFPTLAIFALSFEHTWTPAALSTPLPGKALAVLQEKITGQGTWASSSPFFFDSCTLTCSVNWVALEVSTQQTPLLICGSVLLMWWRQKNQDLFYRAV